MKQQKKICIITSTRADYGLLQNIMKLIRDSDSATLQIIATGTHLEKKFGYTANQIENDAFQIDKKVELHLIDDSPIGISKSMGHAQIGIAEAIDELKPDLIVLLGDRYEVLSAASAALIARVPIAHIHGGEITEGAMDDSIRHSITKMAHLHFASTEEYKTRIIQMGENPENVYCVGAPGLDHLDTVKLFTTNQLAKSLDYSLKEPFGVVTYHPVTLSTDNSLLALNALLSSLDEFPKMQFLITYPNADTFGNRIIQRLHEYCSKRENTVLTASLGQQRYLSALKNCEFVIGNSSSGIIEAPSFNKTTINIGDRQKGRIAAQSVIHCAEDKCSIISAMKTALSKKALKRVINPYKKGQASEEIFNIIMKQNLNSFLRKPFYDIKLGS